MRITIILATIVVATIVGVGGYLWLKPSGDYTSPALLNAQGADIGGPFELTAHTGERMTDKDVINRPSLIYFGYTFCPDICPLDTLVMADAVKMLADRGIEVRPVFITVDPARDDTEALSYYVSGLHPTMIGLTGTEAEIKATADEYKVFYSRQNVPGSAAEYLMSHTGYTYLMVPEKGVVGIFRNGFPPERMATDVEEVLKRL